MVGGRPSFEPLTSTRNRGGLVRKLVLGLAVVLLSGCFHATVNTGLTPSAQTIDKPWAMSFIYGLVPPSTVETVAQCPRGAARVETQISFLNGLVSALTFSIVTPMSIKVTCAQ